MISDQQAVNKKSTSGCVLVEFFKSVTLLVVCVLCWDPRVTFRGTTVGAAENALSWKCDETARVSAILDARHRCSVARTRSGRPANPVDSCETPRSSTGERAGGTREDPRTRAMDLKSMINDAKRRELSIYERFSQYDKDGSGEIDEVRRRRRRGDAAKSRARVRRRARGRARAFPRRVSHPRERHECVHFSHPRSPTARFSPPHRQAELCELLNDLNILSADSARDQEFMARQLFEIHDINGDGTINFEEFKVRAHPQFPRARRPRARQPALPDPIPARLRQRPGPPLTRLPRLFPLPHPGFLQRRPRL